MDERFIEGADRRTEGKREIEKRVNRVPFSIWEETGVGLGPRT